MCSNNTKTVTHRVVTWCWQPQLPVVYHFFYRIIFYSVDIIMFFVRIMWHWRCWKFSTSSPVSLSLLSFSSVWTKP